MSRIPCGGFAVLDIAPPLCGNERGGLNGRADRFFDLRSIHTKNSRNVLCRQLNVSSLGWGDFVAFLGDQEPASCRQPVNQIEAPSQRRIPIMHRAEAGRLFRVRIEAWRATASTSTILGSRKETHLSPTPKRAT